MGTAKDRALRNSVSAWNGSGGFAVVYLAFDPTLNRQIALKIPRPHALMQPELRRRFVTEAQAAAKLDHPNIVPVYEAGEDRDLPYIACTFCEGPTLAAWQSARTSPLRPRLAAEIVRDLAHAVQYSHERGILHRDIKPGNVLLFPVSSTDNDQFPFVPRLGDFGLAKLLESGDLDTVTSQLIGTPRYMAPELIKGTGIVGDVTPDIYALGAMLYCLVLGQAPFVSATAAETLRKIVDSDPVPPEIADASVGRDISLICMKCLQKSPAQRYQSAKELADDLDRYLSRKPVLARQTSFLIRMEKWCRRRPAVATLLAVSAGLIATMIVLAVQYTTSLQHLQGQLEGANKQLTQKVTDLNISVESANRHESESDANRRLADEQVFAADLKLADSLRQHGDIHGANRILDQYSTEQNASGRIDGNRSFTWRYLKNRTTNPRIAMADTGQTVWDLQISPHGDRIAQCGDKGIVRILYVQDEYRIIREQQISATEFNCISWCDKSPILAVGGDDGLIRICNSDNLQVLRTLNAFPGKHVYGLTFLPGTSHLYVGGVSPEMQVWDAISGERLQTIATPHDRGIEHLVVSRDGKRIATAGDEGNLCVWKVEDNTILWQRTITRDELTGPVSIVRFTPDRKYVVACALKESIILCDAVTGMEIRRWQGLDRIHGMAVDNKRIICGDALGLMTELNIQDDSPLWRPSRQWLGHDAKISAITLIPASKESPDSQAVVSTDRSGKAWRWPGSSVIQRSIFPGRDDDPFIIPNSICWKDANTLLRIGITGIESLDINTGTSKQVFLSEARVMGLRYAVELDCLVVADSKGSITVVPDEGPSRSPLTIWNDEPILDLSIDQFAAIAVVRGPKDEIAVLDLHKNEIVLRLFDREASVVSPNGRWIVSGDRKTDAFEVLDGKTLKLVRCLKDVDPTYESIQFSLDSKRLIATGTHRMVTVWDCDSWEVANRISSPSSINSVPTFHPDGRTLAMADDSNSVRLLDIQSGRELLTIGPFSSSSFRGLAFAPDGETLVICGSNLYLQLISAGN